MGRPRSLVLWGPFLLLAPVFLAGRAMFWGTPILQFIPWWDYAWTTLRMGEVPLWNPLVGMGAPLIANYQTALFYPPNWIYFVLHTVGDVPLMAWGIAPLVALHMAWAGWGMYTLARQLALRELSAAVSGLAFGLSGYLVARGHFLSITHAAAWLPWILLAAHHFAIKPGRRSFLKLTIVLALQLLAGHAQITWYTVLLAVAWMVFWTGRQGNLQGLLGLVAAGGCAALLTAVQLLPTLEYLIQSQRASAIDFDFALNYSFWPWHFLTLIAPHFFGSPATGDYWGSGAYWEDAAYVGLLPLVFAMVAILQRRKTSGNKALVGFLVVITMISFVLALGKHTPVFPWLYKNVPSFDMFQAPARYLIWAVFALALLAGIGIDGWVRPEQRALYWSRLGATGAFAVALGAGLSWAFSTSGNTSIGDIEPTIVSAIALAGFIGVAIGLLNLLAPPRQTKLPGWWGWAVVAVVFVDLLLAGRGLNAGVGLETFEVNNRPGGAGERIFLDPHSEERIKFGRLFTFDSFEIEDSWSLAGKVLLPNMNIMADIPSANNFDPLVPERYAHWMNALGETPGNQFLLSRMAVDWQFDETLEDYLRIEYIAPLRSAPVRWATCGVGEMDAEVVLDKIASGVVGLDQVLVETSRGNLACSDARGLTKITQLESSANTISLEVMTVQAAWLVLADTWFPGWQVYLDGQRTEIYRADYLFRALEIPAGDHLVEFHYRPPSFIVGGLISGISLIILFYAGYRLRMNGRYEH